MHATIYLIKQGKDLIKAIFGKIDVNHPENGVAIFQEYIPKIGYLLGTSRKPIPRMQEALK